MEIKNLITKSLQTIIGKGDQGFYLRTEGKSKMAALYFLAFAVITVACDTEQGMMHGSGSSMYMGNWNWVQILISLCVGFLLGYLVARRRR